MRVRIPPRSSRLYWRLAPTLPALLLIAACGGDGASMEVQPEDVDLSTSFLVTQEEVASFSPPRDGSLTNDQVVAFLRASLLQFDLVRSEGQRFHSTLQTMEAREQRGGMLNQFRNMMDASTTMAAAAEVIAGSYVRASRTLNYNPAEMEWVREQMTEAAMHLMLVPMKEHARETAIQLRSQAEQMRSQLIASGQPASEVEEHVNALLAAAADMEAEAQEESDATAARNAKRLRQVRPAVTDEMWQAIGHLGGSAGLLIVSGLADPNDPESEAKLNQVRQLFQDALDNRSSTAYQGIIQ
jgi:hypothetical protein